MRIVLDVSYIQRKRAGLGRFAAEVVRALKWHGHGNTLVLHGWSHSLDDVEIRMLGGPDADYRLRRIPGAVKRFYWMRLSMPGVQRFVGPSDVFHSMDPFLPPLGSARGVATVHDLAQRVYPQFFEAGILRQEKHIGPSLHRAAAILVPSLHTREDLLEAYRINENCVHRIHVPVNPVFTPVARDDDAAVRGALGIRRPYVLFVGTLEPRKNVERLVGAFERVARGTSSPTDLVLAGARGWMWAPILSAIRSSPVRSSILLLSGVRDGQLAALYRGATVFAYPSLYEGHGSPVAEAMSSGVPVVTSGTSALKEIGIGASELVDPLDTGAIAEAISGLLTDQRHRARLSSAGMERARAYSHAAAAEEIRRAYEVH